MKNRRFFTVMLSLSIMMPLAAFGETKYISPNNDGVQDQLEIPLKISDRHFVKSWELVVEDAKGNVVRRIGNKVALPTRVNVKGFLKQLATPKKGAEIPSSVIWNGAMDNGEYAPDGTYYYYFVARDDQDNEGKTDKFIVVVDTQAPVITLSNPADKIFGEGAKADFLVRQSGSKEDKWTGVFKNTLGNVVRTLYWNDGEPQNFKWNGSDDMSHQVPDGVYSYEISAVDRAGNSASASISNIIYSAEKPATNIKLIGSRYFSPRTDSELKDITLEVTIPVPKEDSGNKLTAWSVAIIDESGKVYKEYNQSNSALPPSEIVFDGTDESGKLIPQGRYQAVVNASYLNGYVPAELKSPEFVMDTTKPSAQIGISNRIFGGAGKPDVTISLLDEAAGKYAAVPSWKGRIYNAETGAVVREYHFGQYLPESIVWSGFDGTGKLAADAKYLFELSAVDLAGNKGVCVSADDFTLDTKEASILLSASESAFSPNGNKVKDTITFTPILKDVSGISEYKLVVKDSADKTVKTFSGSSSLPSSFLWDGKDDSGIICKDGNYSASLAITTTNGSSASVKTQSFELDTVPPYLEATAPWSIFSLDGASSQNNIPVSVSKCTDEKLWKAEVRSAAGKTVKTFTWHGKVRTAAKDEFVWDGSDETGNKVPDGIYSIVISSTDDAGNSFSTSLKNLTLDSRETKIYITAEEEGISPNGDSKFETQKFDIRASVPDGILAWHFDIRSENGTSVRSWSEKDSANLPATITWDGLTSEGNVAEGTFTGTLDVSYKKGNKVNSVSAPFICTAIPPQLSVKTAPEYFSPDNDGTDDDLFIKLTGSSKAMFKSWSFVIKDPQGNVFWQTAGASAITERIVWDGLSNTQKNARGFAERVQSATDYPYVFTVTDTLGMTSTVTGEIQVDVLVVRDGDVLKMAVPSIIFRSDNADFKTKDEVSNGIEPEIAKNNERVLKRVAEILNKFKDYKVTVVGHANRLTDNEAEETEDNPKLWGPALIPLSGKRAEYVKDYLVKKGVAASRLSTEGKGGTELVVDYKDKDNNWKNRRVEFILEKN
ncbi:MAG: OmpA family protein [Treponema sp.]|nr:OmpA family protein [Treponema sp.]